MSRKIEVNNIDFSYGKKAFFRDFSIDIQQGEYIAIVGANGSGKTTFSRLISGVLAPSKGHVKINGEILHLDNEEINQFARKQISVVLQNPEDQFVGSSVQDDIAFGLENMAVPREQMPKIIEKVAKETKIEHLLKKEPSQLSGGQKQRVAIASTLSLETEYMIFDEATSQLDPQGKKEVMEAIERIAKDKNKTVILVTHDLQEVLRADRVIVFADGKIMLDTHPKHLFTNGEQLEHYHLLKPEILQFSDAFKQAGLISDDYFDVQGLVEALCK